MKSSIKNLIVPILIIIGLNVFTFLNLKDTFYQQEEWLGLGNIFVYGSDYIFLIFKQDLFKAFLGEGRILSSLINYIFYNVFPYNSVPLTTFVVLVHIINSVLVFLLAKALLKQTWPALLGALFFSVNAVAQSAVTWAAAISTIPATTMVLVSLLTFFKSINFFEDRRQLKYKWLIISFIILYISMLFKQVGIFLIPLYIVTIAVFFSEKLELKSILSVSKKYLLPVALFLIIVIVYLITYKSKSGIDALFLTGGSDYFYQTLGLRAILYPFTSISQLFVPPETFLNFARLVTNIYYPFFPSEHFVLIVQTVVLDLLSVILTTIILVFIYILSKRATKEQKCVIWFFIGFIISTFLPYVLISKSFSYLDSRYYYPGVIGASFIIAWIINIVWKLSKYVGLGLSILIVFLVSAHLVVVKSNILQQASIAQERKGFLLQLSSIKPRLKSNKNVFYITGGNDFYLPGHNVPFQNGLGHTLMVWYYDRDKIPEQLIKEKTLFDLGKQGYYEYEGKGFGYFSDIELLKQAVADNNLLNSSVVYLYYDAYNKKLIDKTDELQSQL